MAEVTMPRLSDSMEEGTILKWLKSSGDEVKRGEELVEIETDKATMTYEADQSGVLEIVAEEGSTLAIGEVIARIGEGGSADGASAAKRGEEDAETEEAQERADEKESETPRLAEEPQAEEPQAEEPQAEEPQAEEPQAEEPQAEEPQAEEPQAEEPPAPVREPEPEPPSGDGRPREERIKASPVARRLARERGVELRALEGTGPGGRIVKADVEAAAQAAPSRQEAPAAKERERPPAPVGRGAEAGTAKGEVRVEELTRTQQVVARRMAEAKATIPHFTLEMEIDMEEAAAFREQLRTVAGDAAVPSFNDMIVKACALALREHPRANASYRDGKFELYSRVNVGVAVAAQDALVVPTVFDADTKSLGEIARETRALAERVRSGEITPPELSGGTFTVSNLGMYGISNFTAVINPPQAAILAVGEVTPRAVVRDGQVVARQTMGVTLGCDHRILYGADAARFLGRVRELLQAPVALTL
jgi:pyruvate dehydrogenase E2 component (dihydrolipoamide acetyltransferase)